MSTFVERRSKPRSWSRVNPLVVVLVWSGLCALAGLAAWVVFAR